MQAVYYILLFILNIIGADVTMGMFRDSFDSSTAIITGYIVCMLPCILIILTDYVNNEKKNEAWTVTTQNLNPNPNPTPFLYQQHQNQIQYHIDDRANF